MGDGLENSEKRSISATLSGFKGVTSFLTDVVEGFKGVPFSKAIAAASPWLEAAGDTLAAALPPVKFVLTLFAKLTAIPDPDELAELAFTLSYEHALGQAIGIVGEPKKSGAGVDDAVKRLRNIQDSMPEIALDFSRLSYDDLLVHPFIRRADEITTEVLRGVGYNAQQIVAIFNALHIRFVTHFKTLISHGDTKEKFAPLYAILAIGTGDRSAAAALLEHAQYQRALFEERPVFGKEVFALQHVYIDTECGLLEWGKIRDAAAADKRGLDPFSEANGGRRRLGYEVLRLISDPKFDDAIIVQGVAGAGKSAFTQWLSAELIRQGLRPIRILFRDVRLERNRPIAEALSEAIRYDEETRRGTDSYPRPDDPFAGGAIFKERVRFGTADICPYVVILDGWDEISISVAEGFKVRLDRMLEQIRTEFLHNRQVPVRIIMTGRPSADVANSAFLRKNTPILTLRHLRPDDLDAFVSKLSKCIADPPLRNLAGTGWPTFSLAKMSAVLRKYREEFDRLLGSQDGQLAHMSAEVSRKFEVFGLPLLALLAFRLLSEPGANPDEIISSPTLLYRNLVDLTCGAGGKYIDSNEPVEQQFRLTGGPLRDLLRRTAAAMTVYGKENISYEELRLRLKGAIHDLADTVETAVGDNLLSQLMISYFFKGGHEDLGCEFLHKSFREYLFAEGIVETVKQQARGVRAPLQARTAYWRDFDEFDERYKLSRALGAQLAPQWLSPEVVAYLEDLISWEVARASGEKDVTLQHAEPTAPLRIAEWEIARDLLADVWDWWAEGVHMRPQPVLSKRHDVGFDPPYAQELIEMSMPLDLPKDQVPEPPRTIVADAHLGDALFRLSTWVHFFVAKAQGWLVSASGSKSALDAWSAKTETERLVQVLVDGKWKLFRPAGATRRHWPNYAARINAAGWRPRGLFPVNCHMMGVDFAGSELCMTGERGNVNFKVTWLYCDLSACFAQTSSYFDQWFDHVVMVRTIFAGTALGGSTFMECDCQDIRLGYTYLEGIRAERCDFKGGEFVHSELARAVFVDCNLEGADFEDADMSASNIMSCNLESAGFTAAMMVGATFERSRQAQLARFGFVITDERSSIPREWASRPQISIPSGASVKKAARRGGKSRAKREA
jgi:uncharacterized protein YjbI with pentapeptide repeats